MSVVFRATDPDGLSDQDTAAFTVQSMIDGVMISGNTKISGNVRIE
jgi:hypothetical protein